MTACAALCICSTLHKCSASCANMEGALPKRQGCSSLACLDQQPETHQVPKPVGWVDIVAPAMLQEQRPGWEDGRIKNGSLLGGRLLRQMFIVRVI